MWKFPFFVCPQIGKKLTSKKSKSWLFLQSGVYTGLFCSGLCRGCGQLLQRPEPDLWYLPLIAALEEVTPRRKKSHICGEMEKVFKVGYSKKTPKTPNKYVRTSWIKCRIHILQLRASPRQKQASQGAASDSRDLLSLWTSSLPSFHSCNAQVVPPH